MGGRSIYGGTILNLSRLDLDEIAHALADQTDYEHRWLINPVTGQIVFWTSDTGIDGQTPIDLDESDELCINPLPPHVWYQDMVDFAARVSDEHAERRLTQAIHGKLPAGTSMADRVRMQKIGARTVGGRAFPMRACSPSPASVEKGGSGRRSFA